MATMVKCKCANCGAEFNARLADRRRGWGKFCNKSCKAKKQEKRTGQYSSYVNSNYSFDEGSKDMSPSMAEGEVQ